MKRTLIVWFAGCLIGGQVEASLLADFDLSARAEVCVNAVCQLDNRSGSATRNTGFYEEISALADVPGVARARAEATVRVVMDYGHLEIDPFAVAERDIFLPGNVSADASALATANAQFSDRLTLFGVPDGSVLRARWSLAGTPHPAGEVEMENCTLTDVFLAPNLCSIPVMHGSAVHMTARLSGGKQSSASGIGATLTLESLTVQGPGGAQLTNVAYATDSGFQYAQFEGGRYVPEPSAAALCISGILLLLFRTRIRSALKSR